MKCRRCGSLVIDVDYYADAVVKYREEWGEDGNLLSRTERTREITQTREIRGHTCSNCDLILSGGFPYDN